jgi:ApaG protein
MLALMMESKKGSCVTEVGAGSGITGEGSVRIIAVSEFFRVYINDSDGNSVQQVVYDDADDDDGASGNDNDDDLDEDELMEDELIKDFEASVLDELTDNSAEYKNGGNSNSGKSNSGKHSGNVVQVTVDVDENNHVRSITADKFDEELDSIDGDITLPPKKDSAANKANNLKFVFMYRIRIENTTENHLQVLGRHWVIKDDRLNVLDKVNEPTGGVVGQYPVIPPGGSFEYTSGTHASTPVASISGHLVLAKVPVDATSASMDGGEDVVGFGVGEQNCFRMGVGPIHLIGDVGDDMEDF